MIWGFGASLAVCEPPRRRDPSQPDPRAIAEMRAYDRLPPEIRGKIANSRYGCGLAEIWELVQRRGCPPDLRQRILARAGFPCTEEVVLEQVTVLEEAESERLQREGEAEIVRGHRGQSSNALIMRRALGLA